MKLSSIAFKALFLCLAFTAAPIARAQSGCLAEIDGDGVVTGSDLSLVLGQWGPCANCDGDSNDDNQVDGIDLAAVLSRWGGTCPPTVASLTPEIGPAVGGTVVTISGSNLLNPMSVTIGGTPAQVLSSSKSLIVVVTPSRRAGAAAVVVSTQGGSVQAGTFTSVAPPTLLSVTPSAGLMAGGTSVTIAGSGFYGAPTVRFGSVIAASVTVNSATQLSAVTPPSAPGTVDLSVTTQSGTAVLVGGFNYLGVTVPSWATLIEATPNPSVVTNASLRNAIIASNRAWRIRDNASQIEMVLVPAGSYSMGCTPSVNYSCQSNENPVHSVTLTNSFYMGRFEVTQSQWTAVMGSNPSFFRSAADSPSRPVERVSWTMIQGFLSATGLRLPSEAEWEYACRAGTSTAFHNGSNADSLVGNIAWMSANSGGQTHAVGGRAANALGLHDMSGNVAEWVNDGYSPSYYSSSPAVNPPGPSEQVYRVQRGGGINSASSFVRSSDRDFDQRDDDGGGSVGFRVVRTP
jgi:formylglycine-generating enzyme required for sulfatase activity